MLFKADCFKRLRKKNVYENESAKKLRINNGTQSMPKFQNTPLVRDIFGPSLQKVKNPKSLHIEINHKCSVFK